MRYKLLIEYDGSDFAGWQRQDGVVTVQSILENAIYKFSQEKVITHAAGRTDAGVHALGQVVHFDLQSKKFEPYIIKRAINFHLKPNKVAVLDCSLVSEDFHARFSAVKRYYKYIIINRDTPLVIDYGKAWQVKEKLDLELMQEAANLLIGTHDFTSFRAGQCQAKSPVKTIDYIKTSKEADSIIIELAAKSFLHHMVRNIVGTLRLIGNHKWPLERITLALQAKDRAAAGPTAPPCGLYLTKIDYKLP
jgi:tRNA pseudouridine38-40 synthase